MIYSVHYGSITPYKGYKAPYKYKASLYCDERAIGNRDAKQQDLEASANHKTQREVPKPPA